MKPVNHPLYGKLGAFWVEGKNQPFYSIHDALDYQYQNGGDVFNSNGEMIYKYSAPEQPSALQNKLDAIPKPDFNEAPQAKSNQKSGNWIMGLFSRA